MDWCPIYGVLNVSWIASGFTVILTQDECVILQSLVPSSGANMDENIASCCLTKCLTPGYLYPSIG